MPRPYRRLGIGLVILGTVLALSPAFLVSLSEGLQGWNDRGWGLHDWRDTLLVQVGWAFILFGTLVVLWSLAAPRRPEAQDSSRRLTPLLVAGWSWSFRRPRSSRWGPTPVMPSPAGTGP